MRKLICIGFAVSQGVTTRMLTNILFQGPTIMRKLICIGFVVSQGATTRMLTNSSCNSISSKSNFKDEGETKLLLKEMSDNLISADLL